MSWFRLRAAKPRTPAEETEHMRNLLAFLLVGSFIAVLPVFVFKAIPAESKEVVVYMVGQLSGMATLALGFYFVNKAGQDAADAQKAENTGKMADAVIAAATGRGQSEGSAVAEAEEAAQDTADAAQAKADEIKDAKK